MPPDPIKKKLRALKRVLKRQGSKHRRRALKKQLDSQQLDAEPAQDDFGKYSTQSMNGLDRDATRQRKREE